MMGRRVRPWVDPTSVVVALVALIVLAACAGLNRLEEPSEGIDGVSRRKNAGLDKPEPQVQVEPVSLPDLGPAPELTNDTWFHTPEPLRLQDLRGKVVLLEMWTFG